MEKNTESSFATRRLKDKEPPLTCLKRWEQRMGSSRDLTATRESPGPERTPCDSMSVHTRGKVRLHWPKASYWVERNGTEMAKCPKTGNGTLWFCRVLSGHKCNRCNRWLLRAELGPPAKFIHTKPSPHVLRIWIYLETGSLKRR